MLRITVFVSAIVCVGAILIFSGSSSKGGDNTQKSVNLSIKNDLQPYGIDVIGSDDPKFDSGLINSIEINDDTKQPVRAAKPLALLIKNASDLEIVGVSLRWSFIRTDGQIDVYPQIRSDVGALVGPKPAPRMIGKTGVIQPRTMRLFSFFDVQSTVTTVSTVADSPGSGSPTRGTEMSTRIQRGKDDLLKRTSSVELSIDGIFFSDGSFVGKDANYYFDEMRGYVRAKKDFLKFLETAQSSGKDESSTLSEFVDNTPSIPVQIPTSRSGQRYSNQNDAFSTSYAETMNGIRNEIIFMRKVNRSDNMIMRGYLLPTDEDFKILHKLPAE